MDVEATPLQRFTTRAVIAALALVTIWALFKAAWLVASTLLVLYLAVIVGIGLRGAAEFIARKTPLGVGPALGLVVLLCAGLPVLAGFLLAPQLGKQFEEAEKQLPELEERLDGWLSRTQTRVQKATGTNIGIVGPSPDAPAGQGSEAAPPRDAGRDQPAAPPQPDAKKGKSAGAEAKAKSKSKSPGEAPAGAQAPAEAPAPSEGTATEGSGDTDAPASGAAQAGAPAEAPSEPAAGEGGQDAQAGAEAGGTQAGAATGQEPGGQGAGGQEATGREATGQEAGGQQAGGQEAGGGAAEPASPTQQVVDKLQSGPSSQIFGWITGFVGGVSQAVLGVLLVSIIGTYLAASPDLYRRGLVLLVPISYRRRVDGVLSELAGHLRAWIIAQLVAVVIVGVVTTVGLMIIGVPIAMLLGLLAGVLDFIPNFGPGIAAVPAILVAAGEGKVAPTIALYVAVQIGEGWLLRPLIEKRAVDTPPAVLLGSQVIIGTIIGFMGLLMAPALIVMFTLFVRRFYVEDFLGDDLHDDDDDHSKRSASTGSSRDARHAG